MMPMMKKMMSMTSVSTIHMPAARTNSAQASLHHSTPRPAATLRPEPALPTVLVVSFHVGSLRAGSMPRPAFCACPLNRRTEDAAWTPESPRRAQTGAVAYCAP